MPANIIISRFEATLQHPAKQDDGCSWSFLLLPKEASETLPRRGRTTVDGTINGHLFRATLEPDGRLGHWMKVHRELLETINASVGDQVTLELSAAEVEPEPDVPGDLGEALQATPSARQVWDATTTLARLDWIHWIDSAKQQKTREKRIHDACEMLASGKKRVCCFDPSGFYSKAFAPPESE